MRLARFTVVALTAAVALPAGHASAAETPSAEDARTAKDAPSAADVPPPKDAPPAKADAVRALEDAVTRFAALLDEGKPEQAAALYESAARPLVGSLGAESDAGSVLDAALMAAADAKDPAARAERLNLGVQEALVALKFEPIVEAELPAGFPKPGPVAEVVVKKYPAYRAARTPMSDQNRAFQTLFQHITKNDVAMTAPVEMTYARAGDAGDAAAPADKPRSMAFLYGTPDTGTAGKDGAVDVVDLPATTVVSIGVRGDYSEARFRAASGRLDAWLEKHAGEYERAGEPRFMGYNSPMVPPWYRYGEVQIPVKAKPAPATK